MLSLGTEAARTLTTTTKTVPQMQGISSRWLLRMLPWVDVDGGSYRVNRRTTYAVGGGQVSFFWESGELRVVPPSLREVPVLAGFDDDAVLAALAGRFVSHEVEAGSTIAEQGEPVEQFYLVAQGKVKRVATGAYDDEATLGWLAGGDHLGHEVLVAAESESESESATDPVWECTVVAATACTLLSLSRQELQAALERSERLQERVQEFREAAQRPQNKRGEADITIASGHSGEPGLPGTFADYELAPREYQLSVAQVVLRVHTRVADLYSDPMDQLGEQLRLTIEAVRERQEREMVDNPEFGLLHNVDPRQRVQTRSGPPTPDDLDELLTRRRGTRMFLAHPWAIAAFGRECSRRNVYPEQGEVQGSRVLLWRGVPMFPCDKIPVTPQRTSSILALRTGEDRQGVVGLRRTGLPDEHEQEPGLNVRCTGIDEKGIVSYLVSAYYSVALLVPNALGALENVEIAHPG